MADLNCTRCKGAGEITDILDETKMRKCLCCNGLKQYPSLESQAAGIAALIKGRKGLRTSRPKYAPEGSDATAKILHNRAYYVWRMARFHGGADMTMPVVAGWDIAGDPEVKALDVMADKVAKESFGTDLAATARWARAMGF